MIGMRVIEPRNLQPLLPRAPLDANQFDRRNVVAVVR